MKSHFGRVLVHCCAPVALAGVCTAAGAQACAVRHHARLVHNVCNSGGTGSTYIDTGNVAAVPLITSEGITRENQCGGRVDMSLLLTSEYGSLSYLIDSVHTSGSCCPITVWADEFQGDMPKAYWYDQMTLSSASLPNGAPATVRMTTHVQDTMTAANPSAERWFFGRLGVPGYFETNYGPGTWVQDRTFTVGSPVTVYSHLHSTIRDYGVQAVNTSGSFEGDVHVIVRIEVLTPGVTASFCSGHDYAAVVCDGIDFNNDGLFPDTADIDDFLSVFSGGPCSTGECGDIDFNNDGLFPDTSDIDALLSVFSGGPCL